MTLDEVKSGSYVYIKKMNFESYDYKRLLHLGLYEGGHLLMEHRGKKSEPSLIFVRGTFYMLRYDDLQKIEVEFI